MTRIVVVGNGMAGAKLVDELLTRDPDGGCQVTVLGDEPHPAYNRILLAELLAGRYAPETIALPAACRGRPVSVRLGVRVTAIDRRAGRVRLDDDSTVAYDALVLATGASPVLPPLAGLHAPGGELKGGVFPLRTMDDCQRLGAAARAAARAVVIGGGLLGVSAARALAALDLPVELVHHAPFLMERQLDEGAGRQVRRTLERLGVVTYVDCHARALRGVEQVTGVELASGTASPAQPPPVLDCDLVVLACGVQPRVRLAEEAGLAVRRGIVVDDTLRSVTDERIFALGDCAEHRGRLYGLVAPAWEQAAVLADRLSGRDRQARYEGSLGLARLSARVEIAAFGETAPSDAGAHVLQLADATRGSYKKVVIRDGRLVGGILVGDLAGVGALVHAWERGDILPRDPLQLLTPSAAVPGPDPHPRPAAARRPARSVSAHPVTTGPVTQGVPA
jgi:assimilatory nitrate reductase electron transfer subunit